jgi:hypothetical protein
MAAPATRVPTPACAPLPDEASLLHEAEGALLEGVQTALNRMAQGGRLDAAGLREGDIERLCNAVYADVAPLVAHHFDRTIAALGL